MFKNNNNNNNSARYQQTQHVFWIITNKLNTIQNNQIFTFIFLQVKHFHRSTEP